MNQKIKDAFENAKEIYARVGVDVEKAVKDMDKIVLSLHCWQTDDVTGFENPDGAINSSNKLCTCCNITPLVATAHL